MTWVRWGKMSAHHIIFRLFAISVPKLSQFVEIWQSYDKNNFACVFETRWCKGCYCKVWEKLAFVAFFLFITRNRKNINIILHVDVQMFSWSSAIWNQPVSLPLSHIQVMQRRVVGDMHSLVTTFELSKQSQVIGEIFQSQKVVCQCNTSVFHMNFTARPPLNFNFSPYLQKWCFIAENV